MSFLYPLGLLALLAIPVLIIIYIIKNKYTEQVITTTYLWTLSERFLKRRNPLRRITGILSLILQILIVVLIAFSVAQPSFVLYNAAHDYLFVIDGSCSMNITYGSTSRLDRAKEQAADIVNSSADGSTYTIVYAADTTSTLCDGLSDKSRVLGYIEGIEEGYCASGFADALSVAQEKFDENASLKIYLFTDKAYDYTADNFTLVNLSSGEENYAVTGVSYELSDGKLTVTGSALSYESDANLTVSLYVDGGAAADTQTVAVTKLTPSSFTLTSDTSSFSSFTVEIGDKDSLSADNECTVYSLKSDNTYSTLIVTGDEDSDNSFFVKAALTAFGDVQTETISAADYDETRPGGYGLYIFDNYTPEVLPSDGAVWFINPVGSVSNSGFYFQNSVSMEYHGTFVFSTSTSARVQSLLEGTMQSSIYLNAYVQCGLSKSFYTLLSYNNYPMLFAGTNNYGNREVVFAFDFHNTDFVLSVDYIPLMYNLFSYTFPELVSETSYYCGDTAEINVLANCTSIRVDTPLGNIEYLDVSSDVAEYTLTEAGTYTITLMVGGSSRQVLIYAAVPEEERYTSVSVAEDGVLYVNDGGTAVSVTGSDGQAVQETVFMLGGETDGGSRDGSYSELWIWLVALAVLFILDWGVYCYEQYQLR